MKARAKEYRPKQTDYDIADGINRSFVKTDSSKFIKFINGMGLFVDYLENVTHFGETETLLIFRFLRGFVPDHSRHDYVLYVFIIVIIQQNLGRNRYVGKFPDDPAFASISDHVICGDFAIAILTCNCMLSSDETDWSQACAVKVKLRYTDITSLLRSVLV